jgi:type IV secretion system protein VirD4
MQGSNETEGDPTMAAAIGVAAGLGVVAVALIEWPVLVWSTLHGRPTLMNPWAALDGVLHAVFMRRIAAPRSWAPWLDVLPPRWAWIAIDVVGVVLLALLVVAVVMRVDRWRGRSRLGLSSADPRRGMKSRSWAKPRDWQHLQSRSGSRRAAGRLLTGERRAPAPRGGDGWALGELRGVEMRSAPEMHLCVIAPTRSGKTTRVVMREAGEHVGPAVVLSNKTDVLAATAEVRAERGPVWVYAPMSDLRSLGMRGCCWTPLTGCGDWSGALAMAQWIFDADPGAAAASDSSGGARFYNREAVEALLPALLHAAALGGRGMADVLGWLRGGVDALDVPRELLDCHGAEHAALALAGVQALDERPRSLLTMSAAQLIGAYRHPEVQAADRHGFDPDRLLDEGGTLYLIAPEGHQELLAPIFGGLLGELLRMCERRAQHVRDPRVLPLLKILADEAAHLAPLAQLPMLLSVSAGWGARWCLVFQSIAQIRHRYGVQADAVLGNTLCKLAMGPIHDRATRDELVALLGDELVEQTSRTDSAGSRSSVTRHEQVRPKITAEQLAMLGEGEAIAIHGRDLPAVVQLPVWEPLLEAARR